MNSVVREANVKAFDCPTDEATDVNDYPASGPGANVLYNRGTYRGNAGLHTNQNSTFWDSSGQQKDKRYAGERGPLPGIGPLYLDPWVAKPLLLNAWCIRSPVKLKEITDGTASTVLLGEKAHIARSSALDPDAEERPPPPNVLGLHLHIVPTFGDVPGDSFDYQRLRALHGNRRWQRRKCLQAVMGKPAPVAASM